MVGGVFALLLLVWRRPAVRTQATTLLSAAAVVGLVYVLAAPVFSAFRLELVFVPMAAYGLALVAEIVAARVRAGVGALEPMQLTHARRGAEPRGGGSRCSGSCSRWRSFSWAARGRP